ncbi:MAG: hypothetical protein LVT47_05255 [Cyanobacteria bacterium LVE1205-1]
MRLRGAVLYGLMVVGVFLPWYGYLEPVGYGTTRFPSDPLMSSGQPGIDPMKQRQSAEYRLQGLTALQQRQWSLAIARLRQSVSLAPDNLQGRIMLGWALHLDSQSTAAKSELMTVINHDPTQVKAFNAIGIANLVSGDLSHAILFHLWGAWLQPDNEIAYYNLSLAFQRLGLYAPALAVGMRATQLEPENPHPWIALSLSEWSTRQISQAQITYRRALAIDGRFADCQFLSYLNEAGFSPEQIKLTAHILASLSP